MSAEPPGLSGRDRLIVQLIARFRQASVVQLHEVLFYDLTSKPLYRALNRLTTTRGTERPYLTRIERRTVGGARGGSGQYIYALGPRGFAMYFDGRFNKPRTINYHALAVLDTFIVLKRLERTGVLSIAGLSVEQEAWLKVGGNDIRPDMYVEITRPATSPLRLWCEVDMATEGQRQIRETLERYWRAYNEAELEHWPLVVWVAVDDERAKELRWLIEQGPKEARQLFRVRTLANFGDAFTA